MAVAVIIGLALLGGATWSAQDYPMAGNRALNRRVTAALLLTGAITFIAILVYVASVRP